MSDKMTIGELAVQRQNDLINSFENEIRAKNINIAKLTSKLEYEEKLRKEFLSARIQKLDDFEQVKELIKLAEETECRINTIRCGWCESYFDSVEKVREHLKSCDKNPFTSEVARLTERVRELEDALKRYADHETWFGDSEYSTYRDRLICKRHGWEDAEKALENIPLPTLPQEGE